MSDELQLVTTNAASDGWVDGTPGAVSTGYQAQNTVLQALFNGLDKSSVRISGANLIVDPSGVIDDSGLPFVVQSAITLALPTTGAANWYLKVVAGSTALERSIEFTDDRGTYDASKNGFYNTGGERVLNWVYNRRVGTLRQIEPTDIETGLYNADKYPAIARMPRLLYSEWAAYRTSERTNKTATTGMFSCCYDEYNDRILYWIGGGTNVIYAIDRDGSALANISMSSVTGMAVDQATGNLLVSDAATNTVKIYSGFSTTLLTTLSSMYADSICIDNDGNLIGHDAGTGVRRYTGISDTVNGTLVITTGLRGITWDRWNDNLIMTYDSGSNNGYLAIYSGFSDTLLARTYIEYDNIFDLGFDTKYGVLWSVITDPGFADKLTLYYHGILEAPT